jgi:hypothetical protein
MVNASSRSASITAAGIVAILGGLFILLCLSAGFFGALLTTIPGNPPELSHFVRNAMLAMMGLMMGVSVFGIATGIGLIRLRNWARISALIWGGLCIFFGGLGIPIASLMTLAPPPNAPNLPSGTMQTLRWFMVFVYGVPLIVGIWWLILFNRKSIKARFSGTLISSDAALTQKPRAPLPITVLAWFHITSILNVLVLPFLPFRMPMLVFGRVLYGNTGMALLLLSCLVFFVCGLGLLKLKPWSYSLTMGLQVFWLASTAVSMLSPNYKAVMDSFLREMQASFHLPEAQFPGQNLMNHYGWAVAFGLLFAGAILGLLVCYRQQFLEAAASSSSARRVTL